MATFDYDALERLLKDKKFVEADALLRAGIDLISDSHWCWTQWSCCKRRIDDGVGALSCAHKALDIAPTCPLALWEYAASLESCKRWEEAIEAYDHILDRGVDGLVDDPCNEGRSWSLRVISDCWFYRGSCLAELDRIDEAIECYHKHLQTRHPGRKSVVLCDVEREITKLERQR